MYEFEVAFSFCSEDDSSVREINDLLKNRYKTFYYPENQKDLMLKDNLNEYSIIYREKSRVVVIFFRERWGKKGVTLIEHNAIGHRVVKQGFSFTVWVNCDDSNIQTLPPYALNQNWWNIDQYGVGGLIETIERAIAICDGEKKPLSREEEADLLKKRKNYERQLNKYLISGKYDGDSREEFDILKNMVIEKFQPIQQIFENDIKTDLNHIEYIGYKYFGQSFNIRWIIRHSTEERTKVRINLMKWIPTDSFNENFRIDVIKYFDYTLSKDIDWNSIWIAETNDKKVYKSDTFASHIVDVFLDYMKNPDKYNNGIKGGFA